MKTVLSCYKAVVMLLLVLVLGCSNANVPSGGELVSGDIGTRVDNYLAHLVPFGFSGAAMIAREGEMVLNKGYGLAIDSSNTANTSRTIFSTGSITKQFTAAAIMKLEMMGKLNTDDLITEFFDDVPQDKQNIRLHHLLTHTAGLPGALGPDFEVVGRDEMMNRILTSPLEFPVGEQFGYSNCGYSMLAAVIELASGMTYEKFLDRYLFEPSGMEQTGYRLPDWSRHTVAHWYAGGVDNGIPLDKDYPYWNYIGNGGILSTTEDMLKWHRALMDTTVLSDAARQKLYTPFLNDYAYGWDVLDTELGTLIQHDGGSMLGCAADFKRFVDSNTVIMLFSNRNGSDMLMEKGIRERVVQLVFGTELELPLDAPAIDADLSGYQGNYVLNETAGYLVTAGRRFLKVTPFGKESITSLYINDDSLLQVVARNERRSIEVMAAAVRDDFEPFRALVNDDARLERIKQLWYMRLNRYAEMTGPLIDAVVRFSWPSGYAEGALESMVEVQGEKSSIFYQMIWKDGKMIGISPAHPPNIGPQTFLPLDSEQFFTYDIGAARNIRVAFRGDTLMVGDGDAAMRAVRGQ